MLTPPVTARDHIQGPLDASVVLVEYGDYECPYCAEVYPVVKELQQQLSDQLCFAFRNFPLATAHPHAESAAEAAEAAGAQGMFWEMHDVLYENQEALEDDNLLEYASALGLDLRRFTREMNEHVFAPKVREDFRNGVRSGVNGTPSFFINGARYNGPFDLQSFFTAFAAVAA